MSLNYNILWLDDQPQQNRGAVDHFVMHLTRRGLMPQIEKVTTFNNAAAMLRGIKKRFDPDIILVDYRLGQGHTGDKIAKVVRQIFQTTTIIFYSSQEAPELRKLIANVGIDGVYCVHRNELKDRGFDLIERTVKNLVDVVQLRGSIIATAAVLDGEIHNCIMRLHEQSSPEAKATQLQFALAELAESATAQTEAVSKLERNFETVLKSRLFNSAAKATFLAKLLRDESLADEFEADVERLGRYVDEVNVPRNILAHQVAQHVGSKLVCGNLSLDRAGMDSIRITIGNHQFGIDAISKKLADRAKALVRETASES